MATIPADQAVQRFQDNEVRVDKFVNQFGSYQTVGGFSVETLPSFIARKDAEIDSRYPDGFINRGAYASGQSYAVNDIVTYSGLAYLCVMAYTSGATTPNNDRTHWVVYQGVTQSDLETEFLDRDVLRAMSAFGELQRRYLSPSPVVRPSQDFIDAIMSGNVTVVVVGDSISEAADTWYINGWVSQFSQMLKTQIPWVKWRVVNLSLGGRGLGQLADPNYTSPDDFYFAPNTGGLSTQFWPDGSTVSGKSWRDYVKDYEPDLIVMAHQENMGTDPNYMDQQFEIFRAYTETWTKKPWWCVVSCFLPTKYTNPTYGDAFKDANPGRQGLADYWRHLAITRGYGLIDSNATFRMLRDGVRREVNPYNVERNFQYWGDPTKWTAFGSATLVSNTMTFNNQVIILRKNLNARDVDISANFTPVTGAVSRISYRMPDDNNNTSGYSLQYYEHNKQLALFYQESVIATATVTDPTTTHNIRVKATGPWHEVYYNGKLYIDTSHCLGMFAGSALFGYMVNSGTMSEFYLGAAQEYTAAPAYYTEADIFGYFPPSYPPALGGDGIHHLSTKGVHLVYLTAVQEFIEQLKGIFHRPLTLSTGMQNAIITAPFLPAFTELTEHNVKITLPVQRYVMVHISLGYINNSKQSGTVQLLVNGGTYDAWWLHCTSATNSDAHPDPVPGYFNISVPVLLPPGTYTIGMQWAGPAGEAALTSGGGGSSRTLAVHLLPS